MLKQRERKFLQRVYVTYILYTVLNYFIRNITIFKLLITIFAYIFLTGFFIYFCLIYRIP